MKYDYLIVGAGLFGSVFAYEANKRNKSCLVIEKRKHVGGNIYTEDVNGVNVHIYGAHIFHTDNKYIWEYMNQFSKFNNFVNTPMASTNGKLYNLPFNMHTFSQIWGITSPEKAKEKITEVCSPFQKTVPQNLEEQALKFVGPEIYNTLIKGYTEKQWGRSAKELPAFIIQRLPLRFTFDNNYFNDKYQGIPIKGYTSIIKKMLKGSSVKLNTDFYEQKEEYESQADKIIFTGMIDEYFDYCFGPLQYRSLHFKSETINDDDFQQNAVVNYSDEAIPYTRIIEHQHFDLKKQNPTIITYEYPKKWQKGKTPYYPINDKYNNALYLRYLRKSKHLNTIIFAGRLGLYKYMDMDDVVASALDFAHSEFDD